MDVKWQTASLRQIVDCYAKGFEPPKGQFIHTWDWFLDQQKGVVVFALYLGKDNDE